MNLLSRTKLKQKLENHDDFLLLNVLSSASFHKAHIPGSKNIPVSEAEFITRVKNLLGDKEKNYPIVTYCGGFHCSASKDAANFLIDAGYSNVSAFEGGMEDWLAAGYPTSNDSSSACTERCSS